MRLALLAVLFLVGCGASTDVRTDVQRQTRTITRTVKQEIAPSGDIVELTTVTTTTTDEKSGEVRESHTVIEPPRIVGSMGKFLGAAVSMAGGPLAGGAVEKGVDWLTMLLAGGGPAAVVGGSGYVALRRKTSELEEAKNETARAQRQRDEIIDSVEAGTADMPDEHWNALKKHMVAHQSPDTKAAVIARVG